jgi:enolase
MRTIQNIRFIQILDSRGFPTIQCQINDGTYKACSPSGASTGSREAIEIRDGNKTFMGKSVLSAFKNQDIINDTFIGISLGITKVSIFLGVMFLSESRSYSLM